MCVQCIIIIAHNSLTEISKVPDLWLVDSDEVVLVGGGVGWAERGISFVRNICLLFVGRSPGGAVYQ